MGRLIIVAGAGGAGKSFFVNLWRQHDSNSIRIKKRVSEGRAPRDKEIRTGESDLVFSNRYNPETEDGARWHEAHFPNLKPTKQLDYYDSIHDPIQAKDNGFVYKCAGNYYRVDTDSIDEALRDGKNPIVIIRNWDVINKLLDNYVDSLLIYIQSMLSGDDLIAKLVSFGATEREATKRQRSNHKEFIEYVNNIGRLKRNPIVVINDFDANESGALCTQLEMLISRELEGK